MTGSARIGVGAVPNVGFARVRSHSSPVAVRHPHPHVPKRLDGLSRIRDVRFPRRETPDRRHAVKRRGTQVVRVPANRPHRSRMLECGSRSSLFEGAGNQQGVQNVYWRRCTLADHHSVSLLSLSHCPDPARSDGNRSGCRVRLRPHVRRAAVHRPPFFVGRARPEGVVWRPSKGRTAKPSGTFRGTWPQLPQSSMTWSRPVR